VSLISYDLQTMLEQQGCYEVKVHCNDLD